MGNFIPRVTLPCWTASSSVAMVTSGISPSHRSRLLRSRKQLSIGRRKREQRLPGDEKRSRGYEENSDFTFETPAPYTVVLVVPVFFRPQPGPRSIYFPCARFRSSMGTCRFRHPKETRRYFDLLRGSSSRDNIFNYGVVRSVTLPVRRASSFERRCIGEDVWFSKRARFLRRLYK